VIELWLLLESVLIAAVIVAVVAYVNVRNLTAEALAAHKARLAAKGISWEQWKEIRRNTHTVKTEQENTR